MEYHKYVVVVLVYRNVDDLVECISSVYKMIPDSKIIVVNSFYDEESKAEIMSVALENNCEFINVENKGYSYGNNRGIDYARLHFAYDYLIISNPDITIGRFDEQTIDKHTEYGIIAPKIITASGRLQNPMVIRRNKISESLEYKGFKNNKRLCVVMGIGISKSMRKINTILCKRKKLPYQIYAAHGSFVIMRSSTIDKLYPVYDEHIFLFAEEGVLAYKAKKQDIKTGQFDGIIVNHKEDGSMKLSNLLINEELKKANEYFYETYVQGEKL